MRAQFLRMNGQCFQVFLRNVLLCLLQDVPAGLSRWPDFPFNRLIQFHAELARLILNFGWVFPFREFLTKHVLRNFRVFVFFQESECYFEDFKK